MSKYIFITGGVLSSLGKGITAASIAVLLKQTNKNVGMLKIDPYINVDPGTMSPIEHGEVFVTKDGGETDLDLGNYERFLDESFLKKHNFTTGQIYSSVIKKEREGGYLGKTVQVIPHIVEEIITRIKEAGEDRDILVIEIGGTVGDIEGLPFLEAIRNLKHSLKKEDSLFIHVTLVPYIKVAEELKTKPTQHSVGELRRIGIFPNIIVARSEKPLPKELKSKIAISCDVKEGAVIESLDEDTIYKVPLSFFKQDILKFVFKYLNLEYIKPNILEWSNLVQKIVSPKNEVKISIIAKYLELKEAYKSLIEALIHSGAHLDLRVNINWVDSENINEANVKELLKDSYGILVPGGFGIRGIKGKEIAIKYARENNIVFLGICLGMQLAVLEFAKNVLNLKDANSMEFDKNLKEALVYLIDEFIDNFGDRQIRTIKSPIGGTMRLGEYPCELKKGSLLAKVYGEEKKINERHRHRYEINPKYKGIFAKSSLSIVGECDGLIEAIEISTHPWFIAVQFHPEFKSRLQRPSPLIKSFVEASFKSKANEKFK